MKSKNKKQNQQYQKITPKTNLLYEENIHIAFLQETHYETKEKMYIKGFKIFRSDGHNHRKGVATLISTNLICNKYITFKDGEGRFLKIKIKTPEGKENKN